MSTYPVFYDPHGRRRKTLRGVLIAASVIGVLLIAGFLFSLIRDPNLPIFQSGRRHIFGSLGFADGMHAHKLRRNPGGSAGAASGTAPIVAAFFTPWEDAGIHSFQAFGNRLTHVIPQWVSINSDDSLNFQDFDLDGNPANGELIKLARAKGVAILPILHNAEDDTFDPKRASALLHSDDKMNRLADQITGWLLLHGFQGLNLDFENLYEGDYARLPLLLGKLKSRFASHHLILTADIEARMPRSALAACGSQVDWLLLMAYDQHEDTSAAGPIAGVDWTEGLIKEALRSVPPNKLVLGIGSYAYDWPKGAHHAESLTYDEAISTASGYRDDTTPDKVIDFDDDSLNPTFQYEDDHGTGHVVWMLDAASAYNQNQLAHRYRLRGAGLWALGSEDPAIWHFLDRSLTSPASATDLKTIEFPYGIDSVGKGEILRVRSRPKQGSRSIEVDPHSGLIANEVYRTYPSPYVIEHSGFAPKKLVLTFDDGPDPKFTPEVLDTLKRLHTHGTFFLIGKQAEAYPDLVRRIYDEGNEVGSHTFTHPDLGLVSPSRAQLEINATQRAIESILGRSTVLFRPPFNADSDPSAPDQVAPVELADRLHYVVVGDKIDPQDWNLKVPLDDGGYRDKTAQDIASSVIAQVGQATKSQTEGNMILLHDAGGDRAQTVAALSIIVPKLRALGYQFVTVAGLTGKTEAQVMPPVSTSERLLTELDAFVFGLAFRSQDMLAWLFTAGIVLGIGRVVFVTILALRNRRRVIPSGVPESVSVLIAAYNEEGVIGRTLHSILASPFTLTEVVVVDDGSTDATADVVSKIALADPRVRLLRQENGGKASALNHALAATESEIVVCVDADTQLSRSAIARLVRHFEDPRVAAVAGNVQVGNEHNLITTWQSIEYTTSQNLDRRAYEGIDAITVVPGAIGAWRRAAITEVGGYSTDTLAEDMDLTWRLHRAGWKIRNEPGAMAFTEAPDTLRGFCKQRFRWSFGTLQCLWKHRAALGRAGSFGRVAMPTLFFFQVVLQALGPFVDLQIVYSVVAFVSDRFGGVEHEQAGGANGLIQVLVLYGLFFVIDLVGAMIAFRLEGKRRCPAIALLLQRFAYRQMLYVVIVRSLLRATQGTRSGWGKLERTGTVRQELGELAG